MQGLAMILIMLAAIILAGYGLHGYYLVRNQVPLVRLPWPAVQPVLQALEPADNAVLYDLGCGDGRVLRAALAAGVYAQVVGIENNVMAWAWAYLRLGRRGRVICGNLLHQDVSSATRLVAYLSPELMQLLEPKLVRELPAGARLVSVQFPLARPASRIIELPDAPAHAQRLYVYDF